MQPTGYVVTSKTLEVNCIRTVLQLPDERELLWKVLDEGRRESHKKVIANPFLHQLTTGGFCQTQFMKYLTNLLPIHQALEEVQNRLLEIDSLKVFVLPKLFRSAAIQQDLKIWEAVADRAGTPSAKALQYAQSIRETSKLDPERIVAIMYTFYGTILSGGQINKRIVEAALKSFRDYLDGIPEGSGVALYEIKTSDLSKFKHKWHVKLCQVETLLPPDRDIAQFHAKLTAEVTHAFESILTIIEQDVEHC